MSNISRRTFLAAATALAVPSACRGSERPRFSFFQPVNPARRVQAMVHRGLMLVAPENTRPAIEACIADSVEWAEVDLQLTRDGKHVIYHDGRLDGKTNGRGPVHDLTLEQLQRLDAGAWFASRFEGVRLCSLAEVLDLARGRINLYLDCKSIDPALLVREVQAARMESQVVVYDKPGVIAAVRRISNGTVPVMTKYRTNMDFGTFVTEVSPDAVEINAEEVTAELCQKFHQSGIYVQAQVLGKERDQPAVWRRMLDAGVDWLQTDDPVGLQITALKSRQPSWPVKLAWDRGASRYAPENTLPAIRRAVSWGADLITLSIRTTSDGIPVLMHDAGVKRTTNSQGEVRQLTLAQIRELDAGAWFSKQYVGTRVPTLGEALAEVGSSTCVYLDVRDADPRELVAVIAEHGIWQRHFVLQEPDYLTRLKAIDARVRTLARLHSVDDLRSAKAIKADGVIAGCDVVDQAMIDECHHAGIKVTVDTQLQPLGVERLRQIVCSGVDILQTDRATDVLRAIELSSRG